MSAARADLQELVRALHHLWHRAAHCRWGRHREAVSLGYHILYWECVDCRTRRFLAWAIPGASNRVRQQAPWEHPDA